MTRKNIKVTKDNYDAMQAAIDAAQERCKARTIYASDIIKSAEKIERRLSGLLHKKDWVGLRFSCDPNAQTFPNAYKGTPESTVFIIERRASGWFVSQIRRGFCDRDEIVAMNLKKEKSNDLCEFIQKNFNK